MTLARMLRRSVLPGALVALLTVVPAGAAAECASPMPVFSPPSGAALPREATLYLFMAAPFAVGAVPEVEVRFDDHVGESVPVTLTGLPSPPAYSAFRLDFRPGREGAVRVELREGEGEPPRVATYQVLGQLSVAVRSPVTIVAVEEELHHWTCSWQSTRNLTASAEAPAYRVEWATSESEYRAGRRKTLVVPRRMEAFFRRHADAAPLPSQGRIELGHVDCHGHTFEWSDRPVWAGLVALNADGTESSAPDAPTRIDPPSSKDGRTPPKRRGVTIKELLDGKRQPD